MTEQERAFERQNEQWEKEKGRDESLRVADRQTDLLPCPFCGNPPHEISNGTIRFCRCDGCKIGWYSEQDWNIRFTIATVEATAVIAISRLTDLQQANQEIDRLRNETIKAARRICNLVRQLASEKSLNAKQAQTIANLEQAMKIKDPLLSGKMSNNLEGSRPWPQTENQ